MDWNTRYEVGDTPWEKGKAAPPLEEFAQHLGEKFWEQRTVLVPGCGYGHDARWIAERGGHVEGLDFSEWAVRKARELGTAENLSFRLGDFFEPRREAVEVIFEHTCFCAIEPTDRVRYVAAAADWLRPEGYLAAIFFLNPGGESGPPHGCTLAELDDLFADQFALVKEWSPTRAYPGREGREWVRILQKKVGE